MSLREYKPGTTFPGNLGRTIAESTPAWPAPERAKAGAPNVLFIILDDTGFGQLGCYGAPMDTPNLNRLAKNGLLYNNMHTTALCSPTRSCILTGRNHHSNGMSCITEGASGYPGSNGIIPFENGFLSEVLADERVQHVCGRQVAPDTRGTSQRGGAVRSLAAGARFPALLRIPGRRHPPVLSRSGL